MRVSYGSPVFNIIFTDVVLGSEKSACFLPTLVVGLFWKRGTSTGAIAAVIIGFSVTLLWFCLKKQIAGGTFQIWHEVYVGLTASLISEQSAIVRFTTGAALGVVHEAANAYVLHMFSFPKDRLVFVTGRWPLIFSAGVPWGLIPLLAPTLAALV